MSTSGNRGNWDRESHLSKEVVLSMFGLTGFHCNSIILNLEYICGQKEGKERKGRDVYLLCLLVL